MVALLASKLGGVTGLSRAQQGRKIRDWLYGSRDILQPPILGMLYRSYQDPDKFIGTDIFIFKLPLIVFALGAIVTIALLGYWAFLRFRAWKQGNLAPVHTLYMVSHFMIYAVAYIVIDDITTGWLAINIWHNTQYILFVWLFNSNRFKGGVDPQKKFLSYISQRNRFPLYVAVCMAITAVYYVLVLGTIEKVLFLSVTASVVIYQMVNFHHYVVDSLIWKVRKPAIRKNIGISD